MKSERGVKTTTGTLVAWLSATGLVLAFLWGVAAAGHDVRDLVMTWSGGYPEEAMNPPDGMVVKLVPRATAYPGTDVTPEAGPALPAVTVKRPSGQVPVEYDEPTLGVITRMIVDPKAPADPARLRNATTVDTTGTGEEVLRLPPGAGLPELAESPPPDTLVKLQAVAGARPAPRVHTVVDLAIPYAGGPLPEEALSPPDGAVVGLIWKPDTPVLPEAQTADAADEAGMAEIAIPYEGGDLPDEADSPPEGTIVRLIDPGALPAGH